MNNLWSGLNLSLGLGFIIQAPKHKITDAP